MMPSTSRNGIRTASVRCRSNGSGRMITFEMPVSASSVRNTNPFAVPGRCRVITIPAMRTRHPSRACVRSMAHSTPRSASVVRCSNIGGGPIVSPVPASEGTGERAQAERVRVRAFTIVRDS